MPLADYYPTATCATHLHISDTFMPTLCQSLHSSLSPPPVCNPFHKLLTASEAWLVHHCGGHTPMAVLHQTVDRAGGFRASLSVERVQA